MWALRAAQLLRADVARPERVARHARNFWPSFAIQRETFCRQSPRRASATVCPRSAGGSEAPRCAALQFVTRIPLGMCPIIIPNQHRTLTPYKRRSRALVDLAREVMRSHAHPQRKIMVSELPAPAANQWILSCVAPGNNARTARLGQPPRCSPQNAGIRLPWWTAGDRFGEFCSRTQRAPPRGHRSHLVGGIDAPQTAVGTGFCAACLPGTVLLLRPP
jgi:hypothetical protein